MWFKKIKNMFNSRINGLEDRVSDLETSLNITKKELAREIYSLKYKNLYKFGDKVFAYGSEKSILCDNVHISNLKQMPIDYWGEKEPILGYYIYTMYTLVNKEQTVFQSVPEWDLYKQDKKINQKSEYEKYLKLTTK